jgi:hypothetical protein
MLNVSNSLLSYSSFPLHRIKREETQAGVETPYWGELINPFQVGLGNWFTSPPLLPQPAGIAVQRPEIPESGGWPLLTVETEATGDSRSTYERGPSLIGSLGSSCLYKRFLSCLGCYSRSSTKYIFPHCTLFHLKRYCDEKFKG